MINKQELIELYLNGMTMNALGEKYGCSRQYIQQVVKKAEVHRDRVKRQPFTDLIISQIAVLRGIGKHWNEIAEILGLNKNDFIYLDTDKYPLYNGTHRKCTVCKEIRPLDEFYPIKTGGKQLQCRCKACVYAAVVYYAKIRKERDK